jgi:Ca-activated chloride channel family protein
MAARDQAPSRLAAVQQQIDRLAAHAQGTRLGLVVFAGDARLGVPLTHDVAAVAAIARTFVPGAAGRGGTDLGAAIDVALLALQRAAAANGSIVVQSDGEDFGGNGLAAAARARQAGVVVHCLGVGSEAGGKVVVETDAGEVFLQDQGGDDVVTRLDRAGLEAVARAGGGIYLAASAEALSRLHAEHLLPRAVAAAVAAGTRPPAHRYQWFLLAAIGFWMLRVCLPERR